ncbi:carboxymuconolactone decarboxylase family protein [Ramlibacter sp.]|uniref:carboxymuconolactone decarboxylase family protein n=1 Tax=Ramlibacter sp. TaxID=1917967 RepID=UPI0017FDD4CC|nr:carboxymuconolactone decarboxylase family protein [Ramlibacter sp.]MBA2672164.1 carboxymuconolactone decarboxylase family protein [Ramlibacter sp.]
MSNHQRGLDLLARIEPDVEGRVARLAELHPDAARYVVEFGFGEILSRPGLTLQQRELITVAALAAMGTAPAQLKVHVAACLRLGVSRTEVTEAILQMAFYAGFPAALNGLSLAKEVFAQIEAPD